MKIVRLDLTAFGPFTRVSLNWDHPTAGLHIVYGANEAGKSSCLRAVRQWLYGIPHESPDNFLHPYSQLRLAGILEDSRGNRLEFTRRKGRDQSLRDAQDRNVIDPAELHRMLQGIDETTFRRRFGIDHEELQRGGREILKGGGELGTILFAAGAGLADIRKIREELQTWHQQLFLPRGSNPRINILLKELKLVRDRIKQTHLSSQAWIDCRKKLDDVVQQDLTQAEELRTLRARKAHLERMAKALPLVSRRQQLLRELEVLADVPILPEDFRERRSQALANLQAAKQVVQEASIKIERLQTSMAEVHLPLGLLEHRQEIARLHSDLGSYSKANRDCPKLEAECRALGQTAEGLLQKLGRENHPVEIASLRRMHGQHSRIQELSTESKSLGHRQRGLEKELRELSADIEHLELELANLPPQRDVAELKRVLRLSQGARDLPRQVSALASELNLIETQAHADLKQLALFRGTLTELEQLPVPLPETVEHFEQRFVEAAAQVQKCTERIEDMQRRAQELEQELEAIRLGQDVPTEDDLRSARLERDTGWELVREVWLEGLSEQDPRVTHYVQTWAPDDNLAQAFRASLAAADVIVDRLRRESELAMRKARYSAELQEQKKQLAREIAQIDTARQAADDLQKRWDEQWQSAGLKPLSPREMQAWLRQRNALIEAARRVRAEQCRIQEMQNTIEQFRRELSQALPSLPLLSSRPWEDLTELLDFGDQWVQTIEETNRRRQNTEERLRELRTKQKKLQQELHVAKDDLMQWEREWKAAVVPLQFAGNEPITEVQTAIQVMHELLVVQQTLADLQRRIEGIQRDNRMFTDAVGNLQATVGVELDLPVDQVVEELYQRLQRAERDQTRLIEWKQQFTTEQDKLDRARSALAQEQATLEELCRQAGSPTVEDLRLVEERSAKKQSLQQDLQVTLEQLTELASGDSWESFLTEAQGFQVDELAAQITQLQESIHRLELEREQLLKDMGSYRAELKRMDGSAAAAEAQQEAESILAAIRAESEQYIRFRLAALILDRGLERFRQSDRDSVLTRAGELFAELTLGSFTGLRADLDDQGKATLVGVRPRSTSSAQTSPVVDAVTVPVEGMSDGTCDQMYLALRLALLEEHLRDHEPMPWILDDILIKFDDDRSLATLRILGQLATKTQIIFFTHHRRLVDLVKQHLPPPQFAIHEL